jgi:hypothetical protein
MLKAVKNRFFHGVTTFQVLDDDSLEQRRRYAAVPDALRVNDNDRTLAANAKTRSFSAFYPTRSEEQALSLQKLGEQ